MHVDEDRVGVVTAAGLVVLDAKTGAIRTTESLRGHTTPPKLPDLLRDDHGSLVRGPHLRDELTLLDQTGAVLWRIRGIVPQALAPDFVVATREDGNILLALDRVTGEVAVAGDVVYAYEGDDSPAYAAYAAGIQDDGRFSSTPNLVAVTSRGEVLWRASPEAVSPGVGVVHLAALPHGLVGVKRDGWVFLIGEETEGAVGA
jgi:hypothetical protein